MLDTGVSLGFSTDVPATYWSDPTDPFPELKFAVTRICVDGADGGQAQAVEIETAIRLYTIGAAQAAGFPDTGMLAAGYRVDFVVLSDDILHVPSEDIDKVKVVQTYIGGTCVYQR
ncbi:amidohydrolase family protein [Butyricicoccus pullicaecorum]|uniref:amidohydrolase family protein n=1 Tax=Butyricicoccus pullicaecorum TaxID=501571 RepID=UPI0035216465